MSGVPLIYVPGVLRFPMDWLITTQVQCPYCWEMNTVEVDTSQGSCETVEDCSVCCRPMTLKIACRAGEIDTVESSS